MVLDAVSNFVRGSADAAVGSGDTTVSVADASIFPDPATDGEYNVVIWDANNFPRPDQDADVEVLRVTAIDTGTDTLTVTRAQEDTTAAAHPNGSAIHLSPTAKMFSDIEGTFADFWDATAQELTADVNNTNTTTTALEADSGTVDGKDIPGYGTSSAGDTSFGDWETVSTSRPARISVDALAETDGSATGIVRVGVDEDGGTTKDYDVLIAAADASLGGGRKVRAAREITLPTGASYRVENQADPNGNNTFFLERVFEL